MLQITIPEQEYFDEKTNSFITEKAQVLQLEHSLISLSKWESKWKKPFLDGKEKGYEETLDYIRCMTMNKIPETFDYGRISKKEFDAIAEYIYAPMTATTFTVHDEKRPSKRNSTINTSEMLYYYMIAFNIPFECEKWHLNRLMTLIHICSIKNEPPKKMSPRAVMNQNKALNAARRARTGSHG